MSIPKSLRFQILRRDDHACRYCGRSAPEVTLQVDHVVPVALGGSDLPENLVAACRDCNAGKAATSPDSAVVADVAESQERFDGVLEHLFRRYDAWVQLWRPGTLDDEEQT